MIGKNFILSSSHIPHRHAADAAIRRIHLTSLALLDVENKKKKKNQKMKINQFE